MPEERTGMTTRIRLLFATAVAAALAASCSIVGQDSAAPTSTVCAGVSSEAGGCSPDRHTFTSSTCVALAVEWAQVVDKAVVAILDGPEVVDGNAKSVQLRQAVLLATLDVNARLRELDLQATCDVPE